MKAKKLGRFCVRAWLCAGLAVAGFVGGQEPPAASQPVAIDLPEALARAKRYAGQVQTANLAALQAHEDITQAKAARLPSVNALNQFIYTEGNGTSSGVFVSNDGVHVYNQQAAVHEELLAFLRRGEVHRAMAAEAVARAKVEIAARGLSTTVVQAYYAIVSAQRRLANAQISVREATRFSEITEKQEKGGEVARADVIKARIDLQQRQRDLVEAVLAVEKAKIALGVLIFPNFSSNFSVVDDLQPTPLLPPMVEARAQAVATNPDVRAADAGVQQAGHDVTVAKYQYLPSLGLDVFYGINANQYAVRTTYPDAPYQQNLGYAAQATLNVPVWNWGATRSKVKQAELRRDQAQIERTLAERSLQGNLATAYAEAQGALGQLESLRSSTDLAAESLRLTVLRYQAGEATALEVVDAQNTARAARNGLDDGLARYRVALANLQILTGTL